MVRSGWKRPLLVALKALVAVVVILAVGRHVLRTWNDLKRHELTVTIRPTWLAVSGLLYLAGLACCGRFYEQVLRASPTPIALGPALRAYLISHLGKYVPGKAMVVVMRAGLSVPSGARAATAAIATFYETLVMMASGGLIAALGFAMAGGSPQLAGELPVLGRVRIGLYPLSSLLALGLGLAFLVVVAPPVFGRICRTVSLPFPAVGPEAFPAFSAELLARGLGWTALAWVLLGISQLEVARGLGSLGLGQHLALAAVVTAGVAFATVAGFVVAVLPGGLGVREGVLMIALAPALGEDLAVVAALVLRLVWVAAELLSAVVLLPFRPRRSRALPDRPEEAGLAPP
jgi:hypothetical protein